MITTPINTALLSYGMSGLVFHAPLLNALSGFNLSTIVQRREPTALVRWPRVKIVKQLEEVWNDASIELVVINTPNETHYEYTRRTLEAGKHAVVEKPMTVTSREANDLIQLAKEKNKILTVFQNRRWDGDFLTVKKVLAEKLVGNVAEFEAHYDRFRNYIEPDTWKEKEGLGSGILYNLGSHMLDQAVVLFGMPLEVDARLGVQRPGGRVDDFYDIRLRYETFYAIVKSSYLVKEPGPRYILHGVDGSFVKYGLDPQEQALKDGRIPGDNDWGAEPKEQWGKLNNAEGEKFIETTPGNYLAFYQNVYEAIREGKELDVKPEQARDVIRLIEACYESNRTRCSVKV